MRVAVLTALLTTGLISSGLAADFEPGPLRGTQYESGVASPIHSWQGGYFGVFAGVTQSNLDFKGTTADLVARELRHTTIESEHRISNLLDPRVKDARDHAFGGFAGYNYQMQEIVFGVELDYTRSRMTGTGFDAIGRSMNTRDGYTNHVNVIGTATAELQDFGTLRARVGYTMGSFMPYITGGVALGRASVSREVALQVYGDDLSGGNPRKPSYGRAGDSPTDMPLAPTLLTSQKDSHAVGLAAGVGVDVAVSQNLFLRAEWQYVHFGDFDGVKASVNTLRGAAGVKF